MTPSWNRSTLSSKHAITGLGPATRWQIERVTFVEQDRDRAKAILCALRRHKKSLGAKRRMEIDLRGFLNKEYSGAGAERTGEHRGEAARATRISVQLLADTYRFGAVTSSASIPEREIPLDRRLVEQANDELMVEEDEGKQVERGRFLSMLLFPHDLGPAILSGNPLILQLDASTARLHWELAAEPDWLGGDPTEQFLSISRGLTRQLRTKLAPPPDPPPPPQRVLRVMVVADPAEDAHLPGAQEEGMAVADLFERFNEVYRNSKCRVEVVRFFGPYEATRTTVLRELMLHSWDVLHFAGHCSYDPENPAASGWLFSRGERISARELHRLDRIPRFVFSNACESGITPDRADMASQELAPSFAESFFERGVTTFVCTAWPIDDAAATRFALELYRHLLGIDHGGGRRDLCPMYEAMKAARRAIAVGSRETDSPFPGGARTWGAYQHYGNPFFRLFDADAIEEQMKAHAGRGSL